MMARRPCSCDDLVAPLGPRVHELPLVFVFSFLALFPREREARATIPASSTVEGRP